MIYSSENPPIRWNQLSRTAIYFQLTNLLPNQTCSFSSIVVCPTISSLAFLQTYASGNALPSPKLVFDPIYNPRGDAKWAGEKRSREVFRLGYIGYIARRTFARTCRGAGVVVISHFLATSISIPSRPFYCYLPSLFVSSRSTLLMDIPRGCLPTRLSITARHAGKILSEW